MVFQRHHSSGVSFSRHSSSSSKNSRHVSSSSSSSSNNDEWSLPSQNENLPWQCSLCTFENSSADSVCEMCHSMRRSTASVSVPLREPASDARTHSEPMRNLRLSEEEIALRKWEHIVRYCKQVSLV